nr:hypothetical protein [Tanacetum cinerariifolium]
LYIASWFLVVAGKGGRGSWECSGGGGVEGKTGESGVKGWWENRAEVNSGCYFKTGRMVTVTSLGT